MINPLEVTRFNRLEDELFEFAIFSVCVAGKNAETTAQKVENLWKDGEFQKHLQDQWTSPPRSDIRYRRYLETISSFLQKHKIGQYTRLSRVILQLNQWRKMLSLVTWNDMVNFKGIGPKTASFFLLHSRFGTTMPCIDTHICKYMLTKGIEMKVTASIPKYLENARVVASYIEKDFPNTSMAEADLNLWKAFSGRVTTPSI